VEGILALFDVLLGGASLVMEAHLTIGLHRPIGEDEVHAGEQIARRPFDLGYHQAFLVSRRGLLVEIDEEAFDLGQREPPYGPRQPMHDLLPQDIAGG
jgi:hypothetical protein